MRRPSLRKATLLSLLGLTTKSSTSTASAQSPPPDPTSLALLTSFSPSTETLVPASETASSLPTGDVLFTVSLEQPTGNGTTIAPLASQTTAGERSSGTASSTAVVYMGEAVPRGYRKMGLAGALAGAAGVFMV